MPVWWNQGHLLSYSSFQDRENILRWARQHKLGYHGSKMNVCMFFYQKRIKFCLLHLADLQAKFQKDAAVAHKRSALEQVNLTDKGPWRLAKFKDEITWCETIVSMDIFDSQQLHSNFLFFWSYYCIFQLGTYCRSMTYVIKYVCHRLLLLLPSCFCGWAVALC